MAIPATPAASVRWTSPVVRGRPGRYVVTDQIKNRGVRRGKVVGEGRCEGLSLFKGSISVAVTLGG